VVDNHSVDGIDDDADCGRLLSESIAYLWALPSIQSTFRNRHKFAFIENMDFFFAKSATIFSVGYLPSLEDLLKARVRTTGIVEEFVPIKSELFQVYDAGGQRSERRKWIHIFEGVSAVLFVAALSHYSCVLFEDEAKNAMVESLELFDEICNSKWFRKSEMILFLNKKDIFDRRLREGIPLSVCFGDSWKGTDYAANSDDEKEDALEFARCSAEALNFVRGEYAKLKKKPRVDVFSHVMTATDRANVEAVCWDVQSMIVMSSLLRSGFC